MSSTARPRRPLPRRVYWVRRTLVLAVALGLVFGIAQLLGGTGGSDGEAARVVGAEPSTGAAGAGATGDASPQTDPTRGTNGKRDKGSRKKTKTPTPLAMPTGPCLSEDVVVTPKVRETVQVQAGVSSVVSFSRKWTTLPA